MSASKQKKIRQEQIESGYISEKEKREAKEKKAQKKTNIGYAIIFGLFVVVALFLLIAKSGIIEKNTVALKMNDEKFNAAEVNYFYQNAVSNVTSSSYSSYYGLDTSADYDTQNISDFAKYILGVEDESIVTWQDYFIDSTKELLLDTYAVYNEAISQGKTYDEEVAEEIEETYDALETYASSYGYTTAQYIKAIYGKNMTTKLFEKLMKITTIASLYTSEYQDSLTYSIDELEAFYEEEKLEFDVADYEYIYFSSTPDVEYDSEGNEIEATEEETQAAIELAKANAEDAKTRVESGETLESLSETYDNGSYTHETEGSYYTSDMVEWVFDDSRVAGDFSLIESSDSYYLVVFNSRGRHEYNTVNVRHILFSVDSSSLDSESETYEDDLAALQADAKESAERCLNEEFNNGTEDDFAALANMESSDTGSNTNGGLYENIYKGQMVDTFNDWCFDESRQVGDTGIVETSYGYHVMYFSSYGLPYWQVQVTEDKQSHDISDWLENLVSQYTLTEGSGMKYVG